MHKHIRLRSGIGLSAVALLLAPLTTAAGQQSSAYLATANGIVSLAQPLVISIPKAHNSAVTLTASSTSATLILPVNLDGQGNAAITWTPSASGIWTIQTSNGSVRTQVAVAATPTITSITAPGQLQYAVSSSTTLGYVRALAGESAPQGTVTLRNGRGNVVGTGVLQAASEPALSIASITWTPDQAGSYPLIGSYNPASSTTATSTSSVVQPEIVSGVPMVSYRFAPALRLGVTSNVSAVLGTGIAPGSVGFIFDGVAPRGSVPSNSGVATTTWAPPTEGLHLLRAEFTGNNPGFSGVALQQIKVLPAAVPDAIQAVIGASPLLPAGPNALAIGTSQELSGTSKSGAPVVFSAAGSCTLNGSRLTGLRAGTCQVTARSFGGDGTTATQVSYPVTISQVTITR